MTVDFTLVTLIAAPPDEVFGLSLDIDAHTQSMARSGERAVAGVTSGQISLGESVTWRATHFGIPFTMTSRITALDRPHRFVDEQQKGPFRRFRHEHRFETTPDGTRMADHIRFDAPCGIVGDAVERLILGRYLRQLIEQRNRHLKLHAERGSADEDAR